MYGDAKVTYQDITLTADRIEMDTKKHEVYAIYTKDKNGKRVGIPKFVQGQNEFTAASIRYNFQTEKGYIKELKTHQDDIYLQMGTAKRHANKQIHFINGKFTTCDLDHPHYWFDLTKAVMIPNKRIVTGPINLWIKGIPTPIGLPFAVLPLQHKEKSSGLIFPMIIPVSQYGFGFQNLGYYFALKKNDHVQTTFFGSLYSRGTFEIKNQTDYKKRYKYSGSLNLGFSSFRQPFPADSIRRQKITVQWIHQQEANANPYWRFNANVNFKSDNSGKSNLNPISQQYYQNNFNSDINLLRKFPGKPVTIALKVGLKQNAASHNFDLNLPTLNVNVNRSFPFKGLRKNKIGEQKFYEKIGVTYSMEARNRALFGDSLFSQKRFDLIGDQFQNGISHRVGLSYPLQLFRKTLTLNTTANYNLRMNFQQVDKRYDPSTSTIVDDTLQRFGMSHDASFRTALSTNLYTYYRFVGTRDMKMRQVITPQISFQFSPNMSSYVRQKIGPNHEEVYYSPFERSLYRESAGREIGLISYSLNNTFEIKHRNHNKKDTTGQEFVKSRIIDALSISGNYDIFKDSLNFSDLNFNLRLTPFKGLSIVARGSLSPYGWDKNNKTINKSALKTGQGLGRFTRATISTTYTFTSQKSKDKIEKNGDQLKNVWGADFEYYAMNPQEIVDFDIPWKINLTHTFFMNLNTSPTSEKRYQTNQNIMLSGDFSFTKHWKLGFNTSYDIKNSKITQGRLSLHRDMHCWQLSFFWTPIGGQRSFLVRFNATSALLQSAKLELRKPPAFL